ncbi:MAG: hypothetical protein GX557_07940, partial [Chloroflexi bacterium]|nr:hypothetical protein [Chloroflexota bacterium]
MDRRERLRRAYCHEEMDRPAVYTRTGYPRDDPTYAALKAYMTAHSELKLGWNGRGYEQAAPLTTTREPLSRDWERVRYTLHTPAGDLYASTKVSLRGQPGMQESYYIKDRADATRYLSLPLPTIGGDTRSFGELDRQLGDSGIVEVGLGHNPAGQVATLCGSETFALLSVTDRDVLHALCEREMRHLLNVLRFLLAQGVGPFFSILGQEYIVPPLHGPRDFHDFNVRYDRPIIELLHEAGGRVHVH